MTDTQEYALNVVEEHIKTKLHAFNFTINDTATRLSVVEYVENCIKECDVTLDFHVLCNGINNTEDVVSSNTLILDVCTRTNPADDFFNTRYTLSV